MRLITVLPFMAFLTLGWGMTLKDERADGASKAVDTDGDDSLVKVGKTLETLGLLFQGNSADIDKDDLEKVFRELNPDEDSYSALADTDNDSLEKVFRELNPVEDSEYFWKKVKKAVGSIAKAVVASKIAGAIG